MRLALSLARRGLGNVWPNPAVGCVIIHNDRLVGRGWTQPGGRPHAETMALKQAGAAAKGATAYVTLEPCSHHGQTPPCSDALISAGIERVVCALEDPDSRVAGNGFAALEAAGVSVTTGVLNDAAYAVNQGYLLNRTIERPMVTLKMAGTLDGKIATSSGESRWITGEAARRQVHLLRAQHDAVLIGAGTARADDPMLDIRLEGFAAHAPVRIVADGGLSLPLTSRLARTAQDHPTWICHRNSIDVARAKAWETAGAKLLPISGDGHLDISVLLHKLSENGITRLLCEGGAALAASLITHGLVDRLIVFTAGRTIGVEGKPMLGTLNVAALADAPRFELLKTQEIGGDIMQVWRPSAK